MESEVAGARPGRRTANAARKRSAVLRSALELSERSGYPGVTVAEIAEHSGVTARTVFRTFGSKAGIFWHDPFLERLVRRVDPETAPADARAAVSDAAAGAARQMTQQDRELEARRRRLILAEPELSAVGTLSMNENVAELLRRITPPRTTDDQQRRLALFAVFAAVAIASVELDVDQHVDEWIVELRAAVALAALGPLSGQ